MNNKKIAKILYEIANLLEIKGIAFKPKAYQKAGRALEKLEKDISLIYKEEGIKGLEKIEGVGKSIAGKIEEYLKKGKIKYYKKLRKETAIRQIVTHYFGTKGVSLDKLKKDAKKEKIIYSRFTKPAKQLLELAGSVEKAEKAIDKVAKWAKSRNLDYAIETVFKKWLELDRLKPKEIVKKPFFRNDLMVWSETRKKWYVIDKSGEWLEFAGKESEIEWRIIR
ncbi:MAG TPA: helix-hairpin-helix domain-containing protein [Candidatus Paceibacterota bacterium]|nr:helix-hairpin-helix domain-containing protein [Candidatus Paceibacterota bacterium]